MTAHASPKPPHPPSKRSGSQKRKRRHTILVACDDDEFLKIDGRAHDAGLSRSSYLRASGIGTPGPRARRSPPVNADALARTAAALGKVGSNLNQIAHGLNARGYSLPLSECFAALAEVRSLAALLREFLKGE